VQFLRSVVERAVPGTLLITETNVPHADNLSYYGDGTNEAHLVYNFALPVLTLHALQTGDGRVLSEWAAGLQLPSKEVTFFNFLASHDGVGVNPARGLLSEAEIDALVERSQKSGGLVSYRSNPDGSQSVYELNVNYLDALSEPDRPGGMELGEARFLVAQALMLGLLGMPGIYVHSLLGSRGWPEGAAESRRSRTINRQKFDAARIWDELRDLSSRRGRIFAQLSHLLRARCDCPAFNPYGGQKVLDIHPGALILLREAGGRQALCCYNLRNETIYLHFTGLPTRWNDLLKDAGEVNLDKGLILQSYQVVWLARSIYDPR
jgi:sucrose phosphorylase